MLIKKLYLVRHCEAEGQEPDASLSADGRNQAVHLAQALSSIPFDKLYSSPYMRSTQSIEPLALQLDKQITIDDRLEERRLTGEPIENWLEELEKTFINTSYKLEGGESSREAVSRGIAVIHDALYYTKEFALLMTHGNMLALLLNYFDSSYGFHTWKSLNNPDVYRLTFNNDQINSIEHISLKKASS